MPDYPSKIAWDAAHTVQFKLKLNAKTDADIIDHLAKKSNKQGYIKRLIRANMQQENTAPDTSN